MRLYIFVLFVLLFCDCKSQKSKTFLKIRYVNLNTATSGSVSCNEFNLLFNDRIKTFILSENSKDFAKIASILSHLKIDSTNYMPDVRVQLELVTEGQTSIYCLSNLGICKNSTAYFLPSKLIVILKRYMKE